MNPILIRTHDGQALAEMPGVVEWDLARAANAVGAFSILVDGDMDRRLLRVDNLLEFYRTPFGSRSILLGVGMLRAWEWSEAPDGAHVLRLSGPDQMDLLARRVVAYTDPEANWTKSAYADDMIKAVVRENMGALSTDPWYSRGRAYPAAHFSVAPDEGRGKSVKLSFQFRNVLAVLQEIADTSAWPASDTDAAATTVWFDLDYVGPAKFLFRTWVPLRGVDRTGRQSIAPLIFTKEAGNLAAPVLLFDYSTEQNIIYGLGPGAGEARTVDPENDQVRSHLSIWNLREGIAPAGEAETTNEIGWRAFVRMQEDRPRVVFSGDLMDTPQTRFGVDWGYGDIVTIRHAGMDFYGRIDSFNVHSGPEGEQIRAGVRITKALEGKPT